MTMGYTPVASVADAITDSVELSRTVVLTTAAARPAGVPVTAYAMSPVRPMLRVALIDVLVIAPRATDKVEAPSVSDKASVRGPVVVGSLQASRPRMASIAGATRRRP